MDPSLLVQFLAPCLPFLMKLGGKSAEKASERLGEDMWSKAKAVWAKLCPRIEEKETLKEAAEDLALEPDNDDLRVALKVQFKKLLEHDDELATVLAQILNSNIQHDVEGAKIQQTVTGDSNQVVGQVRDCSKVVGNIQGNVTM